MKTKEQELIEWLNIECNHGTMTYDLSHDFAEILRKKLDNLKLPADCDKCTNRAIFFDKDGGAFCKECK